MRGDVGEIQRLFHRGIAAAYHRDPLAAVEEPVAGRARGNSFAAKRFLRRQAQILGRGSGRDDQRIAGIFAVIAVQAKWTLQLDPVDVVEYDLRVETFRVPAHAVHQGGSLKVLHVAGPIVDIGGRHQLASLLEAGDQERRTIGAGRIDGGRVTRGTRP